MKKICTVRMSEELYDRLREAAWVEKSANPKVSMNSLAVDAIKRAVDRILEPPRLVLAGTLDRHTENRSIGVDNAG